MPPSWPRVPARPRAGLPAGEPAFGDRRRPFTGVRSILGPMLKAVLFDVDFTLFRPGPELGPEGYRRLGERHGLTLDPDRYGDARARCDRDAAAQPRARPRRGDLDRVHRADRPRDGGRSGCRTRVRDRHGPRVGAARELLALRGRAARARRAAASRAQDRARSRTASATSRSSPSITPSTSTPSSARRRTDASSRTRRSSSRRSRALDVAAGGDGDGRRLLRGRHRGRAGARDPRDPARPRRRCSRTRRIASTRCSRCRRR